MFFVYSPHLCVGFLILILYPAPASSSATPAFIHTQLCHTLSFTHNFVIHHLSPHHLSHTTLSQTIFHPHVTSLSHTIFRTHTISHTHSLVTHHLSSHHPSHPSLSHTIFHTQLCHTPSFTHHLSHTTSSHTIFHHTIFHPHLCHILSFTTPSFTHVFVTHNLSTPSLRGRRSTWRQRFFAWQAWDLVTSTFTSRGRRGTW